MIGRGQRRLELVSAAAAAAPTSSGDSPRLRGTRVQLRRPTQAHEQAAGETAAISDRIAAARDGDQQALETVIHHYQNRVARFVISLVGRDADYEDLCQTAFVKMAFGLPRLRSIEIFESWMFRIARNVCMDHLRRLRWRRMFVPFTREHEEVAEEEPDHTDRIGAFEAALAQLPPDQRELIGLLRERDWSYEELAEITRSSVSAVGTRLFRARSRLRKIMTKRER